MAEGKWEGKTKGSLAGYRIFVFILNTFGIGFAYFFLRFVAFYFFITARSTRSSLNYFRNIHGYTGLKAYRACYRNYYEFGQVLLDKVAILSGVKHPFTFEYDGFEEHLKILKSQNTGSILLSAHVGNWEIAGHRLDKIDKTFNMLVYDNEAEQMKNYLTSITGKKKFHVIAIRNGEMGHLVELHKAFSNNELIVMHGDRYLPGAETIEKTFMGKPARFPVGPFIMAAKFGVPITVVFAIKESRTHYHFFARKAIEVKRCRSREEMDRAVSEASDRYVKELEVIVRNYPTQWFNFYDFWGN